MENIEQEIKSANVDDLQIDRSFRRRIFNRQIFRAFNKIKKFLFFRS